MKVSEEFKELVDKALENGDSVTVCKTGTRGVICRVVPDDELSRNQCMRDIRVVNRPRRPRSLH